MHAEHVTPFMPREVESGLRHATIGAVRADGYRLVGGGRAKRAFSCLVDPQAGDRVLVSDDARVGGYILAVLERPGEQHATLRTEGDLRISSPNGGLSITGRDHATIASPRRVYLQSEALLMDARQTDVRFETACVVGRDATTSIGFLRVLGETMHSLVRDVLQKSRNYVRRTEGNDDVKARNISRTAEGLVHQHSNNAVITTRKDLRIDGERIHMG